MLQNRQLSLAANRYVAFKKNDLTKQTYILKSLTIFIVLTIFYCCSDRLTFYHKGYKPIINSKLRFDGYYTDRQKSFEIPVAYNKNELWTNPITPKFFFSNGSVAYESTHKDDQQLIETFTKYNGGHPDWGVYQTAGDTLIVEILQINSGSMRMERITNKYNIKKDTLILFMWTDRNGKATNSIDTFYFREFQYTHDPTKSYIRTKKKYNR